MATKRQIAVILGQMTYEEFMSFVTDLTEMQRTAIEDGWCWQPNDPYGEFGLAQMLRSWADAQ